MCGKGATKNPFVYLSTNKKKGNWNKKNNSHKKSISYYEPLCVDTH